MPIPGLSSRISRAGRSDDFLVRMWRSYVISATELCLMGKVVRMERRQARRTSFRKA
jgi:hypothetical protein